MRPFVIGFATEAVIFEAVLLLKHVLIEIHSMKCLDTVGHAFCIVSLWPNNTPFRYILRANNAYVVFLGKIRGNEKLNEATNW